MRNILVVIIIITSLFTVAYGSFEYGGMKDIGARPIGLGGAYVGLADEADATYWNPAGIAQNKVFKEVTVSQTNLFGLEVLPFTYLSVITPEKGIGAFGLSASVLGNSGYYTERMLMLTYAKNVYKEGSINIHIGSNIKYMNKGYSDVDNSGNGTYISTDNYGYDAGLVGSLKRDSGDSINIGMVYRGYLQTTEKSSSYIRLGLAYKFKFGSEDSKTPTIIALDYDLDSKGVHAGNETEIIRNLLTLRVGYNQLGSSIQNITTGFGITLTPWRFDYAIVYQLNNVLPFTHRVSMITKF